MVNTKNQILCSNHLINYKMQQNNLKTTQKAQLCFQILQMEHIREERKFVIMGAT